MAKANTDKKDGGEDVRSRAEYEKLWKTFDNRSDKPPFFTGTYELRREPVERGQILDTLDHVAVGMAMVGCSYRSCWWSLTASTSRVGSGG